MKPRLLVVTMLLAVLAAGFTDTDPVKNILEKLERLRSSYPQEKVHIHLDKPYYAIGDDIWFKAYVVNSERNQLSNNSKILYVELIDGKDAVKQSARLTLTDGLGWGNFHLSDSLGEGNYRIRAYTTWMRNFGEDFFFDKTITIGNVLSNDYITDVSYSFSKKGNAEKVVADIRYTDWEGKPVANREVNYDVQLEFRNMGKGKATTDRDGRIQLTFTNNQPWLLKTGEINTRLKINDKVEVNKSFPVKSTSNNATVQFFPEGGELVEGIRSRVAFKAVGADGLGINVSGYISDESNTKVANFSSQHAGMGVFGLTPQNGKSYKATVIYEDGSEKIYDLPKALNEGYVLSANNAHPENLMIEVSMSPSLAGNGQVTIVGHTNGVVSYVSKSKSDSSKKTTYNATVPKNRFSTGILHLTLFSSQNEPVSERLVFIDNSDQLDITVNGDPEYSKRQRSQLSLTVKDSKGQPQTGSFSVAVVDESKVPFDDIYENTILSNLLLSSDIKGYVEQPNYYFTNVDQKKISELDNLLLTQGWRRFTWKSILADAFPLLSFRPERDLSISGQVTDLKGKPVAGGKVTLLSSAGDVFVLDTITDSNGRFTFDNIYFADSTRFVVQARNAKDRKKVEIALDYIPPQLVTRSKNLPEVEVNVNRSILAYLKNSRKQFDELRKFGLATRSILLSEVKVVEKKPVVKESANLNGAGVADGVIRADQLENCFSLDQCLQGRVAGVVVKNGIAYATRNMYSSFTGLVPMQLILDGMYVEPTYLNMINPKDVETIEVLKSASNTAIYGLRGGGGVLIITTKRGKQNMGYSSYALGVASYHPKGIHKSREFYAPNYDDPEINTKIADLRTTVYWNPQVVTDQMGKAYFEYFNADGTGDYKVVVEGVDANGNIGRAVYRYKVK
ncbi:MAG TPA: carboxypeptidase regulatory-like domain-containing protein [Sphingobacteriaceae bacterium]